MFTDRIHSILSLPSQVCPNINQHTKLAFSFSWDWHRKTCHPRNTSNILLGLMGMKFTLTHGLSQQGVWVPFWTPKPLKRTPQDTQIFLCGISKNLNIKFIIEFFHFLIIPMTLNNDIMPYFDEFIHVYGWKMKILWPPLKFWIPQNFTTANFRHPVSKSWLRHCLNLFMPDDHYTYDTFEKTFIINRKFPKYLKDSCGLSSV